MIKNICQRHKFGRTFFSRGLQLPYCYIFCSPHRLPARIQKKSPPAILCRLLSSLLRHISYAYDLSYVLYLIHLMYFSLMLGRVMLTCDSFALVGWASTPKGGFPYPSGTKWRMFTWIKNKYLNPTNVVKNEHRLVEATMAQLQSEIRPQKSGNHMHFAKANDVALTFATACHKTCRKWNAVSKDVTTKEREHMAHTKTPRAKSYTLGRTWLIFCHRAQWMTYHCTTKCVLATLKMLWYTRSIHIYHEKEMSDLDGSKTCLTQFYQRFAENFSTHIGTTARADLSKRTFMQMWWI